MTSAIAGWRVLVPRGGPWGRAVASRLIEHGAVPVIAPLIDFAPTEDVEALSAGLGRLAAGDFDWLVVTSATTVGLLEGVSVPETTRIAAVGSATAAALAEAGLRVDFLPSTDFSADALVSEWPDKAGSRILLPQSAIAEPTLAEGLRGAGNRVVTVAAYRTIGVRVAPEPAAEVRSGAIRAILVVFVDLVATASCSFVLIFVCLRGRERVVQPQDGCRPAALRALRRSTNGAFVLLRVDLRAPSWKRTRGSGAGRFANPRAAAVGWRCT